MTSELTVLQVVRLKGRVGVDSIAAAGDMSDDVASRVVDGLVAAGACSDANGRIRLTPAGREWLNALLDQERDGLDRDAIAALYEEFHPLNAELKELASSWQMRDGELNDHADAAYDQAILDRLAGLHERAQDLVLRMGAAAPRLAPYPGRFRAAIKRVQAGDHSWLLRPLIDSYHTVWFELHEDLIGLCGLTREGEAVAGRAE